MNSEIDIENPIHDDSVNRIEDYSTSLTKQRSNAKDEILEKQIRDAISAYSQLPFVNALLFGFTAATSFPCKDCHYLVIQDIIIVLLSCSMILSLSGLCLSILTVYHTYKLLAEAGAQECQSYILETSKYRDIARNCTYGSFLVFIISFALCPIFTYSIEVSITLIAIFVFGILWITYCFLNLKNNYQEIKTKFRTQRLIKILNKESDTKITDYSNNSEILNSNNSIVSSDDSQFRSKPFEFDVKNFRSKVYE